MKNVFYFTSAFILLTIFNSCQQGESASFLAIGHTRQAESKNKNPRKVIEAVEKIPFEKYDAILLGGDLVLESTKDSAQLNYLNKVFNLQSPNTMWAMGNHDYRDHPELVSIVTGRPTYFAYKKGDVSFLVLDTQLDSCNIKGEQLELFNNTIADLSSGDQLIILHHKLIWMREHPLLAVKANEITNGMAGDCFFCLMKNNFYKDIYPSLVKLEKKGIEVIMVAGDIGSKVSEFEYKTKEGIVFLATGLEDAKPDKKVLILNHTKGKSISWEFKPIESLFQ